MLTPVVTIANITLANCQFFSSDALSTAMEISICFRSSFDASPAVATYAGMKTIRHEGRRRTVITLCPAR